VVNALLFITIAIEVAAIVEPALGAAVRQCVAGGKPMTSAQDFEALLAEHPAADRAYMAEATRSEW
jgi:hypothetical protein